MRIVHVAKWFVPGMGYEENCLPHAQSALGNDVHLVTSTKIPPGVDPRMARLGAGRDRAYPTGSFLDQGVWVHRLRSRGLERMWLVGLKAVLLSLQPDVIHVHGAAQIHTLQVLLYARSVRARLFVDDHSHESNFRVRTPIGRAYIGVYRAAYRVFSERLMKFLPVTYAARQILISEFRLSEKNLEVLPLGADTSRFVRSTELRKRTREELKLADDALLIVYAGKFAPLKRIDFLLSAFQKLARSFPNAKLLLIGNGPEEYMAGLKGRLSSSGMSDTAIWIDFVPNRELPRYYNASDFGVWPGAPSITVLEAASTGLPTVVPAEEMAYRMLFESKAAIGFAGGNMASLANALKTLAMDSTLRHQLGANAYAAARAHFSWEVIAQESLNTYRGVRSA